jgi:hypothetical protein
LIHRTATEQQHGAIIEHEQLLPGIASPGDQRRARLQGPPRSSRSSMGRHLPAPGLFEVPVAALLAATAGRVPVGVFEFGRYELTSWSPLDCPKVAIV